MPREKLVPFLTKKKGEEGLNKNHQLENWKQTCHARTTPPENMAMEPTKTTGKFMIVHCHVSLFWRVRLYSSILHCDQPSCIFIIRKYSFKSQKSRQKRRPIFTHISWESKGTPPMPLPPKKMVVKSPLIRPSFLGRVALGGAPLDSHDIKQPVERCKKWCYHCDM